MIAGDFNQFISSNEIQLFFNQIRVQGAYHVINQISFEAVDKIYIQGSKAINSIAVSNELMYYIEDCQLVKINDIIMIDYRAYIIEMNITQYFDKKFSN